MKKKEILLSLFGSTTLVDKTIYTTHTHIILILSLNVEIILVNMHKILSWLMPICIFDTKSCEFSHVEKKNHGRDRLI